MTMNQIDLPQGALSNRDRVKSIAKGIEKGKGINAMEVARELQVADRTVRDHAKALGCYHVAYIGGKSVAFITSL